MILMIHIWSCTRFCFSISWNHFYVFFFVMESASLHFCNAFYLAQHFPRLNHTRTWTPTLTTTKKKNWISILRFKIGTDKMPKSVSVYKIVNSRFVFIIVLVKFLLWNIFVWKKKLTNFGIGEKWMPMWLII